MKLIERYIFRRAGVAMAMILGSLVGVVWIIQALKELDVVTTKGQTIIAYLALTTLAIPMLILRWIEQGGVWNANSGQIQSLTCDPPQIVFESDTELSDCLAQSLSITAEYVDGAREVMTHSCRFSSRDEGVAVVTDDGMIIPQRPGDTAVIVSLANAFVAVNVLVPQPAHRLPRRASFGTASNAIDLHIDEKLAQLRIVASKPASDEEFLRRVMIDTIGAIPSPDDVRRFCADVHPEKRVRKIDELLAHPMHAALWATRMCDITKCDVRTMGEDDKIATRRAQMWHDWFRQRFADNCSYVDIVRGVLTATSREGRELHDWMECEEQRIHASRESFDPSYAERDTLDLFWRRAGDEDEAVLKELSELTAVAFLGVRLNCAQCHKHPFDRWTQDDYASFTNIFSRRRVWQFHRA